MHVQNSETACLVILIQSCRYLPECKKMIVILKMTVCKTDMRCMTDNSEANQRSDYVTKISRYYDVIAVMSIGD